MKIQGLREILHQKSYRSISVQVMEEGDRAFVEWNLTENKQTNEIEDRPLSKIEKGQMCDMGVELLELLRVRNMLPKEAQGKKIKFLVKLFKLGDWFFKFIESTKNECVMLCYYTPVTVLDSTL